MKKISSIVIMYFFLIISVSAQRPIGYARAGLSILMPWNKNSDAVFFPAITVSPGIRMMQSKNFALSLSFPLSIGGTYKNDTYLGIDLPAMIDLNIGSAAGNNEKANWGFILSAGLAYINAVNNYDNNLFKAVHTEFWGYRFQLAVSTGKEKENNDHTLILISYGQCISDSRAYMAGVSIQLVIGN